MHVYGVGGKSEGNIRGKCEIILKLGLNKYSEMVQVTFSWLGIGTSHSPCHLPELLCLKIYTRVKSEHDQISFTTDVWVWPQASPCQICGEQNDNWTVVSPSAVAVA
jgi:hypothetical protein